MKKLAVLILLAGALACVAQKNPNPTITPSVLGRALITQQSRGGMHAVLQTTQLVDTALSLLDGPALAGRFAGERCEIEVNNPSANHVGEKFSAGGAPGFEGDGSALSLENNPTIIALQDQLLTVTTPLIGMHFNQHNKVEDSDSNLYLSYSYDGTNWQQFTSAILQPPEIRPNCVRNGFLFQHSGRIWAAVSHMDPYAYPYSDTPNWAKTDRWSLLVATNNLTQWTFVTSVFTTNVEDNDYTWTPAPFVDEDGGVHVFWSGGTAAEGRARRIYYQYATDTNNLTTWSDSVEVEGTWSTNTSGVIDPCPLAEKVDGKYVLFYVTWTPHQPNYAVADALEGPYVQANPETEPWLGWDTTYCGYEAVSVIKRGSRYLMLADSSGCDGMHFSSAEDIAGPWSAPQLVRSKNKMRALSYLQLSGTESSELIRSTLANPKRNEPFLATAGAKTQTLGSGTGATLNIFTNRLSGATNLWSGSIYTNGAAGWYQVAFNFKANGAGANATNLSRCSGFVLTNNFGNFGYSLGGDTQTGQITNRFVSYSTPRFLYSGVRLGVQAFQETGGNVTVGSSDVGEIPGMFFSVTPLYP